MFSQKEKDRRVSAAEKRLDEANARVETHADRLEKAKADVTKEEKGLAWLREAPVDEDDSPSEPELGSPVANPAARNY